ncbi:MAG: hypothetical protein ABWZ77_05125 [Naasia sp.]
MSDTFIQGRFGDHIALAKINEEADEMRAFVERATSDAEKSVPDLMKALKESLGMRSPRNDPGAHE